jgi:FkbM family methyltransferase
MGILHSGKRRIAEWMRPESRALRRLTRKIGQVPRHLDGKVRVWGWDLHFVDAASCMSAFDFIVVRRWLDFLSLRPDPTIIDCGANIGIAALHFKNLYPAARVIAFEPDHQICQILRKNIEVNGVTDVDIFECALWNHDGEMTFNRDGADGGHLVVKQDKACGGYVKTTRLREFLKEPVDFLKIDIEGAEGPVLIDCGSLLSNVKMISLEFHTMFGRQQDLGEILNLLTQNGFRYYVNSPGPWRHLNDSEDQMDSPFDQLLMISAQRTDVPIQD